jgi:hypothetical protein
MCLVQIGAYNILFLSFSGYVHQQFCDVRLMYIIINMKVRQISVILNHSPQDKYANN